MKTIEEKAKAYDEIIERAKTMLAAGEVMYGKENNASQLITDIIPELKESEDERIRKAIMGLTYIDGIEPILTKCSITAQDIRKYLEKQKEQKPAWSEEDEKNMATLFEILNSRTSGIGLDCSLSLPLSSEVGTRN